MQNSRVIKKRIHSVKNTRKITRTMEMVATTKSKRAMNQVNISKDYLNEIYRIYCLLQKENEELTHVLLQEKEKKPQNVAVLLITSNRGLCGAYNSNIIRLCRDHVKQLKQDGKNVSLYIIGKKGIAYFRFQGYEIEEKHTDIDEKVEISQTQHFVNLFIENFKKDKIDEVYVASTFLESSTKFTPVFYRLLPFTMEEVADTEDPEILCSEEGEFENLYLFEPDITNILDGLLPLMVNATLYHKILEANASEQISRRVAMKQATDSASDMIKRLTQSYNRARQYKITQEIAEIISGSDALV